MITCDGAKRGSPKPQPGNERRSNLYLNTRIFQDAARFIFHLAVDAQDALS